MLEVAIVSTKCALRDEIPEFMEFFNEKPWEKKNTENTASENSDETENSQADCAAEADAAIAPEICTAAAPEDANEPADTKFSADDTASAECDTDGKKEEDAE